MCHEGIVPRWCLRHPKPPKSATRHEQRRGTRRPLPTQSAPHDAIASGRSGVGYRRLRKKRLLTATRAGKPTLLLLVSQPRCNTLLNRSGRRSALRTIVLLLRTEPFGRAFRADCVPSQLLFAVLLFGGGHRWSSLKRKESCPFARLALTDNSLSGEGRAVGRPISVAASKLSTPRVTGPLARGCLLAAKPDARRLMTSLNCRANDYRGILCATGLTSHVAGCANSMKTIGNLAKPLKSAIVVTCNLPTNYTFIEQRVCVCSDGFS